MKSLKENLLRSIARRGVLVLVAGIGLAAMAWLHVNAPDSMKTWLATAWGVLATGVVIFHLDRWLARRNATEAPTNLPDEDHAHYRQIEAWANKLFQAIDQNPTTVFITDAEGRFEYVNDFFLTSTGYTRDEVLGQSMEILSPQETDAPTSQEMRNCAQRGACWQGEVQTRRRDGSVFWERVMFSPLKDRHGKLTNFVAIKENITEWRQVMTRLQESEHRFRTATSAMVEGLALIGPDGRFLFANRAACRDCAPKTLASIAYTPTGRRAPPQTIPLSIRYAKDANCAIWFSGCVTPMVQCAGWKSIRPCCRSGQTVNRAW